MNEYLQAVLMILLTIVLYYISKKIQDKYKNPLLNPALIASIAIIIVLLVCGVSYKGYMKGGTWINHVLNATVVCLAYPLYQNKKKIKIFNNYFHKRVDWCSSQFCVSIYNVENLWLF